MNNKQKSNYGGKTQKEKVKEITDQLEAGVSAVFESSQYKAFLECCAKFHSYSVNNCLLILLQCPEASRVAGYVDWQRKFDRHVKKGAKGIKILAPCKYKVPVNADGRNLNVETNTDRTSVTPAPAEATEEQRDRAVKEITGFKVVTVFDVSATEGKELPSIGAEELTGEVKNYRKIFDALVTISPVPIYFEDIEGGAKGYYNDSDKRIAIKEGMSEAQTIKTLLHEISHAQWHSKEALDPQNPLDRRHIETEAEGIAYCVGSALNIVDSGSYSFPYLASYASGKDTKELKDSLERIRSAADVMITGIEKSLERQAKREIARSSRDEAR